MRIGMITGEFPPMQGGVGDFTLELSKALVTQGHEVFVLTNYQANPVVNESGVNVQASVEQWGRWGKTETDAPRGSKQAEDWVQRHQLDVVNIQYQAAAYNMHLAANRLPNTLSKYTKVITTFHDLLVPYLFPKAGGLRKRVVYQMAQKSDGVIVTNRQDEEELQAVGNIQQLKRIPIGSNIAVSPPPNYDANEWRDQLDIPPTAKIIGFFGFINKSKGVDTLAQAARILVEELHENVHLLFIGGQTGASDTTNIEQADMAQELIGGLGIAKRCHWTGFVTNQEVSANLMACDIVALPYKDGVSLRRGTLMAALAHGNCIVTTYPQQPDPDLVDGETMVMVPPDNPRQLAQKIHQLFGDPQLRETLGQNAKQLGQQFSWETIANDTLKLISSITSR